MKTSRADASRRRPVAFREKAWVPPRGGDSAAMNSLLSGHELAGFDLVAPHVDDSPVYHSLRVCAARVHDRRLSDSGNAFRFVDMSVQRKHGLMALDQLAHRGRSDRDDPRLPAVHDHSQVI